MPWKRELYPSNWQQIRSSILERAGHRCERCRKPNGQKVWVVMPGGYWYDEAMKQEPDNPDSPGTWCDSSGAPIVEETLWDNPDELLPGYRMYQIRVVLTTAHLVDHDPMATDPSNLAALCQYHHLNLDAKRHAVNAAATRRRKATEATGQEVLL